MNSEQRSGSSPLPAISFAGDYARRNGASHAAFFCPHGRAERLKRVLASLTQRSVVQRFYLGTREPDESAHLSIDRLSSLQMASLFADLYTRFSPRRSRIEGGACDRSVDGWRGCLVSPLLFG